MPKAEALFSRDISVYVTVFMEFVVFGVLFIFVYFLIKKLVVDNMEKVNRSLSEITGGNLDVVVDVRSNEEFASLSDDINSTVLTLKRYIAEAAARIDRELEFAKAIQHSAIPSVFPPFPGHSEFDIFASMYTAKEVGGDFYDFYFVGEDRIAFLVADVSGKGIPAAMFMMTSKTIIKGYAESGIPVNDVFTVANEKLCESNEAGMFVTAWMGVLELKTGLVEFANAGHNPPLVRHRNGKFEYLRVRPGLVLAGMEDIKYKKNELKLSAGDEIFLYTDGVTEKCKNSGNIESDYNAGGIVGNISVDIALDMENDLHLSGLLSKSAKHLIYAVVMDCESYATVTGKYAGVGGIAGNMDYGRISSGVSGGTIQSTEGDYVGGIAGYSAGTIANCLSRVNLSGKNYIGGIAGRAETVTGSYALVAIDTASERAGAICGAYEGEIRENYFATASGSTT